jgi:hypothetical protein
MRQVFRCLSCVLRTGGIANKRPCEFKRHSISTTCTGLLARTGHYSVLSNLRRRPEPSSPSRKQVINGTPTKGKSGATRPFNVIWRLQDLIPSLGLHFFCERGGKRDWGICFLRLKLRMESEIRWFYWTTLSHFQRHVRCVRVIVCGTLNTSCKSMQLASLEIVLLEHGGQTTLVLRDVYSSIKLALECRARPTSLCFHLSLARIWSYQLKI